MRDYVLILIVGVRFAVVVEGGAVVVYHGRIGPFALGFEEKGEGIGADVYAVQRSVVDAL